MIEVPVEACEPEEVANVQPEAEVEASPEVAPEVAIEAPAPKKRGRPRKVQAPPQEPPPVPTPAPKAKTKTRPRAPPPSPRPIQRVPEERYPQAGIDTISSTELVAELLSRRASANRDNQRQMFRSWLS